VALTFFSYAVCDNDPYDEMSIAVVIRRRGARGPRALDLMRDIRHRSFFAHVLALPVSTEFARLRGFFVYQLPKWLTKIEIAIGMDVRASIAAADGEPDLNLVAPLPTFRDVPSQSRMGANTLSFSQQLFPRNVTLSRGGGPMSELLNGLDVSTIFRLDVVRDARLVLHVPAPLNTFDPARR